MMSRNASPRLKFNNISISGTDAYIQNADCNGFGYYGWGK